MTSRRPDVSIVGPTVAYEVIGPSGTHSLIRAALIDRDPSLRNPEATYTPLCVVPSNSITSDRLTSLEKDVELVQTLQQLLVQSEKTNEKLMKVYEAACGLVVGVDWNNGTQALTHNYRQQLIDAVADFQNKDSL